MTTARTATPNGSHSHTRVSAWHTPGTGPSQYDFRSDVMTTPTLSMLEAIQQTSLLDDVMLEDPETNSLEAHVAALAGKEAALLVMSGTMGNQVSLRTHLTAPPHSIVCDWRSHVIKYEVGGASLLSGAMTLPIRPSNKHHVTLADIEANAIVSSDVHACPTRVIWLENTLNGTILPQSEVEAIAAFARANDIALHLDGARIWEVAVATKTPVSTLLAPFDSASLCFSKGLGAPIGSIITFGLDAAGQTGKLGASHAQARAVAEMWQRKGGKLSYPVETNMVWLDHESLGVREQDFVEVAVKHGIKVFGSRLVVHYQISADGVARLGKAMDEVLALAKQGSRQKQHGSGAAGGAQEDIYGSKTVAQG
ncbi:hypothetical protein DV737_g1096, partial [Chaetothyriales sp. CBS 132003]